MTTTMPATIEIRTKSAREVVDITERVDARIGGSPGGSCHLYLRHTTAGLMVVTGERAVRRPGHCSFDGTERERAFDDLVAWMERGVVPAGDDVLGAVAKLGLRLTPSLHPDDPARRP